MNRPSTRAIRAHTTYSSGEESASAGSAGNGVGSVEARLLKIKTMRAALGDSYERLSATLAPTVIEGTRTETISMALYMQNQQAALDLLIKMQEDRLAGKPDPHLMQVQKATLELIRRDMVQMTRPTAALLAGGLAVFAVCNVMLFMMALLHLVTVRTELPPPGPRNTSVTEQR